MPRKQDVLTLLRSGAPVVWLALGIAAAMWALEVRDRYALLAALPIAAFVPRLIVASLAGQRARIVYHRFIVNAAIVVALVAAAAAFAARKPPGFQFDPALVADWMDAVHSPLFVHWTLAAVLAFMLRRLLAAACSFSRPIEAAQDLASRWRFVLGALLMTSPPATLAGGSAVFFLGIASGTLAHFAFRTWQRYRATKARFARTVRLLNKENEPLIKGASEIQRALAWLERGRARRAAKELEYMGRPSALGTALLGFIYVELHQPKSAIALLVGHLCSNVLGQDRQLDALIACLVTRAHLELGNEADARRWLAEAERLDPECMVSAAYGVLFELDIEGERDPARLAELAARADAARLAARNRSALGTSRLVAWALRMGAAPADAAGLVRFCQNDLDGAEMHFIAAIEADDRFSSAHRHYARLILERARHQGVEAQREAVKQAMARLRYVLCLENERSWVALRAKRELAWLESGELTLPPLEEPPPALDTIKRRHLP